MGNTASLPASTPDQAIADANAQLMRAEATGDAQGERDGATALAHALGDQKRSTAHLMFGARQTGSPSSATSLSADTPPAAPWTPNSTEQSMLRDVAKTTEDPAQFASIMKEKVATFRAENSGTDDIFKGSPYDQGPEKLDQYLTDQFESTKLSLNTELADQEASSVR